MQMIPTSIKIFFLLIKRALELLKYLKYPITILLFCLNTCFAQQKTFMIKDKVTNQSIYLVAISTQRGNGVYSAEDGSFSFLTTAKDTLTISHLSYQQLVLSKKDLDNLDNSVIFLTPKVTELAEVRVNPAKLTKKMLGYYDEKTTSKRWGPGGFTDFEIFLNHLKNPTQAEGYINKLYFDLYVDITEGSGSKARVRIYSVGADGLPKDDILTKEIIKRIDRISPNLRIDISSLKIVFPPEGVFIGLEFFCTTKKGKLNSRGVHPIISDCPHVPVATVANYQEAGNSYMWSSLKGKSRWACVSDGSKAKAWTGQVFKFGAEVSQ